MQEVDLFNQRRSTSEETETSGSREESRDSPLFRYIDHIRTYPTFMFAGSVGSRVATVAFLRNWIKYFHHFRWINLYVLWGFPAAQYRVWTELLVRCKFMWETPSLSASWYFWTNAFCFWDKYDDVPFRFFIFYFYLFLHLASKRTWTLGVSWTFSHVFHHDFWISSPFFTSSFFFLCDASLKTL